MFQQQENAKKNADALRKIHNDQVQQEIDNNNDKYRKKALLSVQDRAMADAENAYQKDDATLRMKYSDEEFSRLMNNQKDYLDANGQYHARSLDEQITYLKTLYNNHSLSGEQQKQLQSAIDSALIEQGREKNAQLIQQQQDFAKSLFELGDVISQAQYSQEEDKNKAIGEAIRNFLINQIDMIEKAEVAKALATGFSTLGASLLAIAPIVAAAEAGKAGLRSIKFHQGGVVNTQNSLPAGTGDPTERQIIVKTGERVLTEDQQRYGIGGVS